MSFRANAATISPVLGGISGSPFASCTWTRFSTSRENFEIFPRVLSHSDFTLFFRLFANSGRCRLTRTAERGKTVPNFETRPTRAAENPARKNAGTCGAHSEIGARERSTRDHRRRTRARTLRENSATVERTSIRRDGREPTLRCRTISPFYPSGSTHVPGVVLFPSCQGTAEAR